MHAAEEISNTYRNVDSETNKRRTSIASLIAAAQNAGDKTNLGSRTTTTVPKFNSIAVPHWVLRGRWRRGAGEVTTCGPVAREHELNVQRPSFKQRREMWIETVENWAQDVTWDTLVTICLNECNFQSTVTLFHNHASSFNLKSDWFRTCCFS